MQRSAISTANEVVSIAYVCNQIGMRIPDLDVISGRSYKTQCPFGDIEHVDGGLSSAFRVYPATNSAWCFACSEYFSPVKLWAKSKGISSWQEAAEQLLSMVGHSMATDERWAAVAAGPPVSIDQDTLASALKIYCSRIVPDWDTRQFEAHCSNVLARCLELLPLVKDTEDAERWLTVAKEFMTRELTRP